MRTNHGPVAVRTLTLCAPYETGRVNAAPLSYPKAMNEQPRFPDPHRISEKGTEIYDRLYRAQFELEHSGRFAAIDLASGRVFVADLPEDALETARMILPRGVFYLVRVGSPAAFRISRVVNAHYPGSV